MEWSIRVATSMLCWGDASNACTREMLLDAARLAAAGEIASGVWRKVQEWMLERGVGEREALFPLNLTPGSSLISS